MMLSSWTNRLFAVVGALMLAPAPAKADIFLSGEFSLSASTEEHGDGNGYEFTAAVPQTVAVETPVILPDGCTQTSAARQSGGGRVQYVIGFECARTIKGSDTIETPWRVDGANFVTNVMGAQVSRTLVGGPSGVSIPIGETAAVARPVSEIAPEFTWQGMLHIWMGWDHLAFVFILCLLAKGMQLIRLVTAFTIGHSISLALAFFELVRIPIPPVEAIIALSIAFMAREAMLLARQNSAAALADGRRHIIIVSLFGLLHGLGFASALDELGVLADERIASLIFFNIGVEIGQLVFVGAMMGLSAAFGSLRGVPQLRTASLYAVGILGCFWMVERVSGIVIA